MFPLADLIDASWTPASTSFVVGVNAGGYTTVVSYTYEADVAGTGATIKPNGGDTAKTLFIPNAGGRNGTTGTASYYGDSGRFWSTDRDSNNTSNAWDLRFYSGSAYTSGYIGYSDKIAAYSIRCVRS